METIQENNVKPSSLVLNTIGSLNATTTYVKIKEFSCTWTIDNFEHEHRFPASLYTAMELTSPHFNIGDKKKYAFCLILNENIKNCNYFSIFPKFYEEIKDDLDVRISILNSARKEAITKRQLIDKGTQNFRYDNVQEDLKNFVKKKLIIDKKDYLLPNGALTIVCKISITEKIEDNPDSKLKTIQPQRLLNEFDDYERLLASSKFSDFKLIVDKEEIPVHRNILAARSPVFAAMLEHDTKESRDGKAELFNITAEVTREMLRFIYAGKINDIELLAPGLLVAAERYQLAELKNKCQEILLEKLSLENVDEVIIILDRCNAERLKKAVIEFVTVNSKELSELEKFNKALMTLSLSFLMDIIKALMVK